MKSFNLLAAHDASEIFSWKTFENNHVNLSSLPSQPVLKAGSFIHRSETRLEGQTTASSYEEYANETGE